MGILAAVVEKIIQHEEKTSTNYLFKSILKINLWNLIVIWSDMPRLYTQSRQSLCNILSILINYLGICLRKLMKLMCRKMNSHYENVLCVENLRVWNVVRYASEWKY